MQKSINGGGPTLETTEDLVEFIKLNLEPEALTVLDMQGGLENLIQNGMYNAFDMGYEDGFEDGRAIFTESMN